MSFRVLLESRAAHPIADDVQEREDAGPRAVDDPRLEVLEVAPAGAAGVGHGRDARAEREAVGIDAVVARVRTPFAGAGEDVHVDVDKPGRDVQPRDVHGLECLGRVDLRRDGGDLAAADGHVGDRVDLFLGSMTWPP